MGLSGSQAGNEKKKEGIQLDSQITISRNNADKEIIVKEWGEDKV